MDMVAGRFAVEERKPIRHLDLTLLIVTVLLVVVGQFLLYSATNVTLRGELLGPFTRVNKQVFTAVIGLLLLLLTLTFDYRFFKVYAGFLYAATVVALILVKVPGIGSTDSTGIAQRWFSIGGLQITPSEFTKVAVIVMLATLMSEVKGDLPGRGDVFRAVVVAGIPLGLVFIQPDIGTTIVLIAVVVGILVVAGTRARHLAVLATIAVVLVALAFNLHVIKQYQIDRITDFLHPNATSADVHYNLQQSELAVGDGGMTGRGYLSGPQTILDYVPEQHTDFIFTVAAEEFGFVGAMFVLVLFAILLWRAIRIAYLSKDPFGRLVASGIAAMFAIQMFVNIGMTIGIMPITGIPLPFLSYGGTSLLVSFVAIGMLENIHMRRFK